MCQQHRVVTLAAACRPISPGKIAALTTTTRATQLVDGEWCSRPIDERDPHRLPSRAKKAVAFFRMSRSCRRISFSRRSRFSSAVTSLSAATGSTACRSRLRPIQRTSVDRPIPRSPAISRCVRPLVCTRRTASSANSFVNRRCCVIEFLIAHGELSTFPKQVQYGWHEGRNPDAYFSTTGYLNANPDVKAAGIDPLTHYDQYGWKEGRNPSAQFDTEYYLLHNPDVAAAGVDPLQHYLQNGIVEERPILPAIGPANQITASDFDPQDYLMANPDVAASGMNPYQHLLEYGWL